MEIEADNVISDGSNVEYIAEDGITLTSGFSVSGSGFIARNIPANTCEHEHTDGRWEYNIKDHLGNTRIIFSDIDDDGTIDVTGDPETNEIIQENHFYAGDLKLEGPWNNGFGLGNPFTMQGNEEIGDFDLNTNVYQFRHLDPATWTWWQSDPMGEEFSDWSPYNLSLNNPVNVIDPNGAYAITLHGSEAEAAFGKLKSGLVDIENMNNVSNDPNDGIGLNANSYNYRQTAAFLKGISGISVGLSSKLEMISGNNYSFNYDLSLTQLGKSGTSSSMLLVPRYFDSYPDYAITFKSSSKIGLNVARFGRIAGRFSVGLGLFALGHDAKQTLNGELHPGKLVYRSAIFGGSLYASFVIGGSMGGPPGAVAGLLVSGIGYLGEKAFEVASDLPNLMDRLLHESRIKLNQVYRIK